MTTLPQIHNGQALPLKDIPELTVPEFRSMILERVRRGRRISSLFGMPDGDQIMILAVLAHDSQGMLELCRTRVRDRYPALTPDVPQAHWFEREIAEQWGIVPEGHPWLKPIRFHASYVPNRDAWGRDKAMPIEPCVTNYFRVEGEEIHEVAVGPVHAGIIEPGHFRFQCHGENVLHLEIELGYQHRGIERARRWASADCGLRIADSTSAMPSSIRNPTIRQSAIDARSITWRRSPATPRSGTPRPTPRSWRRSAT